jgi:3-phosphoshikimate 1-carboxyvinyltransferase
MTNRALALAALADGESHLTNMLVAEDRSVMVTALRKLGIAADGDSTDVVVRGQGGVIPASEAELDLRLSGTAIRFLAAMVSLGHGRYRLDGTHRMRERPIQDLLDALTELGAHVSTDAGNGCPPVTVEGRGLAGGDATVQGGRSSQYLSALLMVAPYARDAVTLHVPMEQLSKPFVDMTVGMMASFGVDVQRDGYRSFYVPNGRYRAGPYRIEADAMAAGYHWAAAAVTGGHAITRDVGRDSVQGDKRLADVLATMGCQVTWEHDRCVVAGPTDGRLHGGTFDLNDMPDQAQTLAVAGLFATAPVRITNIWNLRIKETDRLTALATELRRLGAHVELTDDAITVHPLGSTENAAGTSIQTYGDHRMAMSFAVAGLRIPDLIIEDPSCVDKTYPTFFDDWRSLGGVAQ